MAQDWESTPEHMTRLLVQVRVWIDLRCRWACYGVCLGGLCLSPELVSVRVLEAVRVCAMGLSVVMGLLA